MKQFHNKFSIVFALKSRLATLGLATLSVFVFAFSSPICAQVVTLPGQLERMGLGPNGEVPDQFVAQPHLSHDGRLVIFSSKARNLLPGIPANLTADQIYRQWYLFDRQTRQLERVSVNSNGQIQQGPIFRQSTGTRTIDISRDGRYVVFESLATNLDSTNPLPSGAALSQIFLHDRTTRQTGRISEAARGGGNVQFDSDDIHVSYVCGETQACRTNIVTNVTQVRNLPSPYRVPGAFSKNGRYVTCYAEGSDLGLNVQFDYLGRCDLSNGTVTRIAVLPDPIGASTSIFRLSADGNVLVFSSYGPLDGSDPDILPGFYNVYVWRAVTNQIELISKDMFGTAGNDFDIPQSMDISDDGRRVAFLSQRASLGGLSFFDFQSQNVVYVRDLDRNFNYYGALIQFPTPGIPVSPGIASCERVPVPLGAPTSNATQGPHCPELSGDGNVLAFSSHDWRWVANDPPPEQACPQPSTFLCSRMLDVFVKPLGNANGTLSITQIPVNAAWMLTLLSLGLIGMGAGFARRLG